MGLGCLLSVVCVDTAAVGQFNVLLRCSFFVLGILLAAIEKRRHDSESEMMSKSPFHGLARTAPCNYQGERFVATATNQLCTWRGRVGRSCGYKILHGSRLFALYCKDDEAVEAIYTPLVLDPP